MNGKLVDEKGFFKLLRNKYYGTPENDLERIIESILDLMRFYPSSGKNMEGFLEEVAKLINRRFRFRKVTIGLKDLADDIYRYKVVIGYTGPVKKKYFETSYTYEEMIDTSIYPAVRIGRDTEFNTEPLVEEERDLYNIPSVLGKERSSFDQFMEGDYIEISMYGPKRTLIGWVEVSSPTSGKPPEREDMKWLELVTAIISRIIWETVYSKEAEK